MKQSKSYLIYLAAVVIVMAIVVITYAAIQAEMFGHLIFGVVLLGVAILLFSWATAKGVIVPLAVLRLDFIRERNEHERRTWELRNRYKALPAPRPRIQDTDPRRPDAIKLLRATLQHKDYGPQSDRIISADDAQAVGVMNRSRRQEVITLLSLAYGVYTNDNQGAWKNGTYLPTGKTVMDLYEDMLHPVTALDEAVLALPGIDR